MYSDKVQVLRFETEPYRKHLDQNGSPIRNGASHYNIFDNNNDHPKHIIYQNGYHNTLIETESKSSLVTTTASTPNINHHHVQPPSDPIVASVLLCRQNPRPGRLLLENVKSRPNTMDRGTQANTDTPANSDGLANSDTPITEAPSTSHDGTNSELYRNANISVTNQKIMANSGDNSSVDSLNSADSAKRNSAESVIELAELHQPMISKDDTDGHHNMSNGDGKYPGDGDKHSNGVVKVHPVDEEIESSSCGMECLYFTMQCCECSIM